MNSIQTKDTIAKRDGLKCHISEQPAKNLSELKLHKVRNTNSATIDAYGEEILNPDDYILVHKELGETKRSKSLELEFEKRIRELELQEISNYERERNYREQVELQRKELEDLREKLITEQRSRYAQLSEESKLQAESYRRKEDELIRHIEAEKIKLHDESVTIENQKNQFEMELAKHHNRVTADYAELEREKEKYKEETIKNIERRSGEYVNDSITSLDAAAKKYHSISRNWSVAGFISLILGVSTGIYFGAQGLSPAEGKEVIEWSQVVFYAFKGVIVIGLFVALSKYCFMYGQSFMHESIKNGERKHAINFGKFYLQSYGVDAQWSQVKEAFEHWNINSASAFSGHDPDKFDPKIMDKALQFAESFQKLSKANKTENDPTPPVR